MYASLFLHPLLAYVVVVGLCDTESIEGGTVYDIRYARMYGHQL